MWPGKDWNRCLCGQEVVRVRNKPPAMEAGVFLAWKLRLCVDLSHRERMDVRQWIWSRHTPVDVLIYVILKTKLTHFKMVPPLMWLINCITQFFLNLLNRWFGWMASWLDGWMDEPSIWTGVCRVFISTTPYVEWLPSAATELRMAKSCPWILAVNSIISQHRFMFSSQEITLCLTHKNTRNSTDLYNENYNWIS